MLYLHAENYMNNHYHLMYKYIGSWCIINIFKVNTHEELKYKVLEKEFKYPEYIRDTKYFKIIHKTRRCRWTYKENAIAECIRYLNTILECDDILTGSVVYAIIKGKYKLKHFNYE